MLDGVNLWLEVGHHLLVNLFVAHVDDAAVDVLLHQMAVLVGQFYLGLGHVVDVAAGVDAEHTLACRVGDPFVVYLVVVAEEDDVETRHFASHRLGAVLFVLRGLDAAVQS